jgi:hypothetical protein
VNGIEKKRCAFEIKVPDYLSKVRYRYSLLTFSSTLGRSDMYRNSDASEDWAACGAGPAFAKSQGRASI